MIVNSKIILLFIIIIEIIEPLLQRFELLLQNILVCWYKLLDIKRYIKIDICDSIASPTCESITR